MRKVENYEPGWGDDFLAELHENCLLEIESVMEQSS